MANDVSSNTEASLAAAVRDYLAAEPNQFISEDENLRNVCDWLARLTQELLKGSDDWSRYAWVDAISPCTVTREPPHTVVLTGLMIWMNGDQNSGECKEPLLAAIHLSAASSSRLRYELRVGDASRGLAKCPYGTPHDYPYVAIENWLFAFISENEGE